MRVSILGGGGMEGTKIASVIARDASVSHVLVADRNISKAQRAAELAGPKAEGIGVDADDQAILVGLCEKVDMVVNLVGPYYTRGTRILEAAIAGKAHYLDICDDYDVTRDLLALNAKAQAVGITAVINCGSSPGLVNVLAKYAAGKLDKVDEINVTWSVPMTIGTGGLGGVFHSFHMLGPQIPQFLDGKTEKVPGGSGRKKVTFPFGTVESMFVGHPEPVTLPLNIEGVQNVTCRGVAPPDWFLEHILKFIELGLGSAEPMPVKRNFSVIPREVAIAALLNTLRENSLPEGSALNGLNTEVLGRKDGHKMRYMYDLDADLPEDVATGIPASVGIMSITRGEFTKPGVFAPEQLDNAKFLKMVGNLGLEVYETITCGTKLKF